MYEHICIDNIKKIYKQAGKCDDQHQIKAILETAMICTPKGFTDNSPMLSITSVTVTQHNTTKLLFKKTVLSQLCDAKSK